VKALQDAPPTAAIPTLLRDAKEGGVAGTGWLRVFP
jgi:hypothetical protein